MMRRAIGTVVFVGFLLLLLPKASALPFAVTLARTTCPAAEGKLIGLKMVLESEGVPEEADGGESEWVRQITLGFETEGEEAGFEPFWSMDDKVDEITSPMPTVGGALTCFRYGAGQSLYAAGLIFKSDWQGDWTEAWVVFLLLPVEGYGLREAWRDYVPRLPLPRGAIVTRVSLAFMAPTSFVGILATSGRGPTPYLLYGKLQQEGIWLYSGGSARKLGTKADASQENKVPGAFQPGEEWQGCRSVLECVVEEDLCGNLVPIRRGRIEEFRSWARDSVMECGPQPRWRADEAPTFLCEKGLCTIRWVEKEYDGENLW